MLFISDLVFFHNYYFTVALFDITWYSHPYLFHIYIHYIHLHNHGFTPYNCRNIHLSYHCQFTSSFYLFRPKRIPHFCIYLIINVLYCFFSYCTPLKTKTYFNYYFVTFTLSRYYVTCLVAL